MDSGLIRGAVVWFFVSLVVLACLPGMMSGNYLPKTLWAALTVGIGLAFLSPSRDGEFNLTPLGAVWLAYLGWALLSLSWTPALRAGLERWMALLLPTLAYLLARRTRFWDSKTFWSAFCLLVGTVSTLGILQYFFPAFPLIKNLPGTAVPRATLGSRNYASMYLLATFPFLFRTYLRRRRPASIIPFLSLVLSATFLLLGKTRGAWVGLSAGMIWAATAGWPLVPRYRKKLIFLLIPFGFSLLLAYSAGLPVGGERSFRDKLSFTQAARTILNPRQRIQFWRPVLGVTAPLIGAGFGGFPVVATINSPEGKVNTLNYEVHNDYLQAYVELGFPGALLFILVFVLLLRLAWKGRGSGLVLAAGASVIAVAVMQFTTFTSEKVSTQIWFAGVAAILNCSVGSPYLWRAQFPRLLMRGLNLLAVLWLLLFALAVGYSIRGDRIFRQEGEALEKIISYREVLENPERYSPRIVEHVQREIPYELFRAQDSLRRLADQVLPTMLFDANMRHITSHQFAALAFDLDLPSVAEQFARQALALHPADRGSLVYLTELVRRRPDYRRFRALLERGVKLFGCNPHSPYFCQRLIQIYMSEGRLTEAAAIRKEMGENLVIEPSSPRPANRRSKVPPDEVIFGWSDCNAAVSYDFFLWPAGEKEPEYPSISGLRESLIRWKHSLSADTVYFWRVIARGRYGVVKGDIWFFRTARPGEP